MASTTTQTAGAKPTGENDQNRVQQQQIAQNKAEQANVAKQTAATQAAAAKTGNGRYVRTAGGARQYHVPIGSEIGTATSQSGRDIQADAGAKNNYNKLISGNPQEQQAEMTGLSDSSLLKVNALANSFNSKDPGVLAFRARLQAEMARRKRMNPKFGAAKGKAASKKKAPAKKKAKGKAKKATHPFTKTTGSAYNRGSGSTWVAQMNKAAGFSELGDASRRVIELARTNEAASPVGKLRRLINRLDQAPPEIRVGVANHIVTLARELNAEHLLSQEVVELTGKWKHGYIPLDAEAVRVKMKGGKGKPWWEGGGGAPKGSPKGSGGSGELTKVVKSRAHPSSAKEPHVSKTIGSESQPGPRAKMIEEGRAARTRQGVQQPGDAATTKAIADLKKTSGRPAVTKAEHDELIRELEAVSKTGAAANEGRTIYLRARGSGHPHDESMTAALRGTRYANRRLGGDAPAAMHRDPSRETKSLTDQARKTKGFAPSDPSVGSIDDMKAKNAARMERFKTLKASAAGSNTSTESDAERMKRLNKELDARVARGSTTEERLAVHPEMKANQPSAATKSVKLPPKTHEHLAKAATKPEAPFFAANSHQGNLLLQHGFAVPHESAGSTGHVNAGNRALQITDKGKKHVAAAADAKSKAQASVPSSVSKPAVNRGTMAGVSKRKNVVEVTDRDRTLASNYLKMHGAAGVRNKITQMQATAVLSERNSALLKALQGLNLSGKA